MTSVTIEARTKATKPTPARNATTSVTAMAAATTARMTTTLRSKDDESKTND